MKDWWANRWLSWQPLRWLGRQSYTLYVWHTLFFWLLLDVLGLDEVLGEKTRVVRSSCRCRSSWASPSTTASSSA